MNGKIQRNLRKPEPHSVLPSLLNKSFTFLCHFPVNWNFYHIQVNSSFCEGFWDALYKMLDQDSDL